MRLHSSPACYNSRVPDAWDYKVLPKTPTKKWVAEGRFELRTFRTGSANATDTPRPIPLEAMFTVGPSGQPVSVADLKPAEIGSKAARKEKRRAGLPEPARLFQRSSSCYNNISQTQCDQFMSETTNDVVFDPKKSEKFGKCRKSFFMSFLTFVCHFTILQKFLFFQ